MAVTLVLVPRDMVDKLESMAPIHATPSALEDVSTIRHALHQNNVTVPEQVTLEHIVKTISMNAHRL